MRSFCQPLSIGFAFCLAGSFLFSPPRLLAEECNAQTDIPCAPAFQPQGNVVEEPILNRQRPGEKPRPLYYPSLVYESLPDINATNSEFLPVPDRWRQFYVGKLYDPYNQNVLKGDIPLFGSPGHEWFLETSLISDTLFERRRLPNPVGFASTKGNGATDVFGDGHQNVFVQNFIPAFSLIRGNTTFRPPDFEFRFVPVLNFNSVDASEDGVLRADPAEGSNRNDQFV